MAHVSDDIYVEYRKPIINMTQVSGKISDKYDNGTSYYFMIDGIIVNSIPTKLYDAFYIGENISVIVDEKNRYVHPGFSLVF
jgi:hypothetical protein